jgi:hypothetical protein
MLLNGLAWSLIVPPFEVPDENAHYAYVQQIAERGTVPRLVYPEGPISPAVDTMLGATLFYQIVGEPENPAPLSQLQQQAVENAGNEGLSTVGDGDANSATNNPPLYYALEAVPYEIGSGGTVLDRLVLMRLMSVLMAAITVLLIFMFLAELLPGTPWAWTAGALVAAFQPLFSFISSGVNSDNLLYLASAGLLWALARSFRRGLTLGGGALIGGFLATGLLTKFTMIGLIPAAVAGTALAALRLWRGERPRAEAIRSERPHAASARSDERSRAAPQGSDERPRAASGRSEPVRAVPGTRAIALRATATAVTVAAVPVVVYLLINRFVWGRGAVPGGVAGASAVPGSAISFSLREELSHVWQLFLPAIGGMKHQFTYVPLWKTWFKGFFGRFGWLDYKFPYHFYVYALVVCIALLAVALFGLIRERRAVRRRVWELGVYVLVLLGICGEVGVQSYREYVQTAGVGQFEQARYLLPMLGLYAAIAAIIARSGGRRWGPAIGVALVMLAVGHDIGSQLITVARYYT